MNPWDSYAEMKRELLVDDADLDLDPYWLPELALRFKESGRTPKKETKAAFLSLFEDPLEWFDTDLFTITAVEEVYKVIRSFAEQDPAVEINLPTIEELFPRGE